MYKILEKSEITDTLTKFIISAPNIAQKALPGQFILLMISEKGERIPLTIVNANREKNTITIIFQKVGYSTKKLGKLNSNDFIYSLVGPLGHPTPIKNYGKVIVLGGGVGIAELLPVVEALKKEGCEVTSILGGRTKGLVILKDEVSHFSKNLFITTDDGSLGEKGLVIDPLKRLLALNSNYGLVFCVGPVPMMKAVSEVTRPYGINTLVCLNSIMIDGTGMCGGCRVTIGGETKFCCVDGPDFNGHLVDYAELMTRQKRFSSHEKESECKLEQTIQKEDLK